MKKIWALNFWSLATLTVFVLAIGHCFSARAGSLDLKSALSNSSELPSAKSVSAGNRDEVLKGWILISARKAVSALEEAIPKANTLKEKIQKTLESLKNTNLVWPDLDSKDDPTCADEAPAWSYVISGTNKIHLCKMTFNDSTLDSGDVAQILVHEAVHLWQEDRNAPLTKDDSGLHQVDLEIECEATQVEFFTGTHSSLGIHHQTGYWKMCGIN